MERSQYAIMMKTLDDKLGSEDLAVLKFLCQDKIKTSRMDNITWSLDLFEALEGCGELGADNLQLLAELLYEAQRIDLLTAIGMTTEDLKLMIEENGHKLEPYRRMLHELSEHMVTSDIRQLKHIMKNTQTIQRSRLEEAPDAYSLFSLLEKRQMISSTDVSCLLDFTSQMDEVGLRQIVTKYRDEYCAKKAVTKDVSIQAGPTPSMERPSLQIPEYRIDKGKTKGICLIINNDEFTPDTTTKGCKEELKGPRRGSYKDAESLKQVFTTLQFEVKVLENLKRDELTLRMKEFATKDHSRYDIFVCCILTHGEAGKIFGVDCLPVSIYSLLARFSPKYSPTLKNKPKVFFVQACQGGRQEDESLDSIPLADGVVDEALQADDLETDYAGKLSNVTSVPRQPDFFLGLATVPGFVSYRSKTKGSWYMQALSDLLLKHHNNTDLLTIVTQVNNRVIEKVQRSGAFTAIQIPLPQYTLRKRIYLRTS